MFRGLSVEKEMKRRIASALGRNLNKALTITCSLALLTLFLIHFSAVRRNALNLPQGDEWGLIADDNRPSTIDLPWLYQQVNDHRTTTTKLLVWAQYHFDGWNVRHQVLLNFLIYGATLGFLVLLWRKFFADLPAWAMISFVAFQLSPIIWPDHMFPYAVAIHFWLLFFLIAAGGMFFPKQNWGALCIATIAAVASAYSFASGVLTSGVLLIFFAAFKILRAAKATRPHGYRRELIQLAFVVVVLGGSLAGWLAGYERPSYLTHYAWPHQIEFWSMYLNLISVSFGIDRISLSLGLFCFLLIVVPIAIEIFRKRLALTPGQWISFSLVAAILIDLAAVATGRAFLGIWWSKVGEYSEHGMPLMLLTAINWTFVLARYPVAKWVTLSALWFFCLLAFSNNWNFGVYDSYGNQRRVDYQCVENYYAGSGDGHCRGTFGEAPHPELLLEKAKKLNLSFYVEMSNDIRRKSNH